MNFIDIIFQILNVSLSLLLTYHLIGDLAMKQFNFTSFCDEIGELSSSDRIPFSLNFFVKLAMETTGLDCMGVIGTEYSAYIVYSSVMFAILSTIQLMGTICLVRCRCFNQETIIKQMEKEGID